MIQNNILIRCGNDVFNPQLIVLYNIPLASQSTLIFFFLVGVANHQLMLLY
jgi:hypothetical protein